ncbi:toxin glutamine deamidase domain-containing protein [Streptomyces cavernicola]|uniref:Toxin glutamine deamidase domain-containing protein n=1 Tax=Streptomyces cavernicola TaxID=3043613 RepID=A0ABT6SG46_9ACTN|nr:toxin glutamine deamidase domain-containing protein [Streptomyces sp. B-S-A6]MDI3407178.1 toxin glutamine deamidase domain-containing protein [Streptomyces sp. B-S-A6]
MMLPDELEWVLEMLGFTWPTADEDKLVQCAEVWEKFAQDVTDLRANATTSASTVMANNAGDAIDKFKKNYDKFDNGGDGYLQDAAQAATIIGFCLRGAAMLVITCKIAVIVQLIALAVQIIAAAAASVVTFGLSNAASMAATAITRVTVRQILDTLKDALVEAIIECMKEPAVSALEAMITDLTRQSVNIGFGAQSGIDVSATVKAGAEGGWEAIKQTPQTFLESVRDSVGSKAGGSIRSGAESYANSGPLGDGSSSLPGTDSNSPAADDSSDSPSNPSDPSNPDSSNSDSTSNDGPSVSSTVSADIGNDGPSGPDIGNGPNLSNGPSLGDFDDSSGSDNSPSTGPSSDSSGNGGPTNGNSNPGGITSPNPSSGPTPSPSNTTPSDGNGRSIGTQVDSLAASAPTATNSTPPPTTSDNPGPSRGDGNHSMPTAPNSPSNNDPGARNNPSHQGGSSNSGGGTATSPNPSSSAPPRNNPSTPGTSPGGPPPSSPNPSNPGPGSTPRPNPGEGSGSTPGGRPSVPQQAGPVHVAPNPSTPHHSQGNSPGHSPGNSPGHSPSNPGTPNAPGQQAAPNTPPQSPANNPPQQAAPVVAVHTVTTTPAPTPTPTPDATNASQQSGANNNDSANKDEASEPTPASSTRDNTPPGGVNDPSRREQNALENSVPRDENGDPTRPPNPNDGNWVERINGDGRDAPGRNNNCVDTALSTVDTYAGNPTAAGARTPDPDADGNPSDRGERGGRDRIENTLGARFNDMGNGRDAYNRLENTLRNSGHGSQAVIITQDANGRAHAWNAVNHNGKITYIDSQTGQRSPNPLHSGKNGVFAIPLDSDRRPVAAGQDATRGGATRPDRDGAASPAAGRQAPAEPAGSGDKNKKDEDKKDEGQGEKKAKKPAKTEAEKAAERARAKEVAGTAYDPDRAEGQPGYGERQPGDNSHTHYDMLTDTSQNRLRVTNDVEQVSLGPVVERLKEWAEPGKEGQEPPLLNAMRESADGRISQQRLNEILKPGFAEMSREEKMATVAAIARLSSSFHDAHAVDESGGADLHSRHNPKRGDRVDPASLAREYAAVQNMLDRDADPEDAKELRKEKRKFTSLWNEHIGDPKMIENREKGKTPEQIAEMQEHRRLMRPDFSGKNYAVLEVVEHKEDGSTETHYVIDSSVPPNSDDLGTDHSEPVLGEAFRQLDQDRYSTSAMYTEFEPCGDKTHPASANCSDYLVHEFERPADQERRHYHEKSEEERAVPEGKKNKTTIYYAAGYRLGDMDPGALQNLPEDEAERAAEIERLRQEAKDKRDEDMHRFRGELLRVWMRAAENAGVS